MENGTRIPMWKDEKGDWVAKAQGLNLGDAFSYHTKRFYGGSWEEFDRKGMNQSNRRTLQRRDRRNHF